MLTTYDKIIVFDWFVGIGSRGISQEKLHASPSWSSWRLVGSYSIDDCKHGLSLHHNVFLVSRIVGFGTFLNFKKDDYNPILMLVSTITIPFHHDVGVTLLKTKIDVEWCGQHPRVWSFSEWLRHHGCHPRFFLFVSPGGYCGWLRNPAPVGRWLIPLQSHEIIPKSPFEFQLQNGRPCAPFQGHFRA